MIVALDWVMGISDLPSSPVQVNFLLIVVINFSTARRLVDPFRTWAKKNVARQIHQNLNQNLLNRLHRRRVYP
jgi:hypothetical protein